MVVNSESEQARGALNHKAKNKIPNQATSSDIYSRIRFLAAQADLQLQIKTQSIRQIHNLCVCV